MTRPQIAEFYGVSVETIKYRFRKSGIVSTSVKRKYKSKVAHIDVEKLTHLYASEYLPLGRIAQSLAVSTWTIKEALKLYRIPQRRRPSHGGKHFDRLRTLKIGQTLDIACPVQHPQTVLLNSARRLGIKIFIEPLSEGVFRVTRLGASETRTTFKIARLDRRLLEELRGKRKLSIKKIADRMDEPVGIIRQALEAFDTPEPPPAWGFGKYTSVLSRMEIGDSVEMKCAGKRPHTNLHTIASRRGIKISMRHLTDDIFRVKRIG